MSGAVFPSPKETKTELKKAKPMEDPEKQVVASPVKDFNKKPAGRVEKDRHSLGEALENFPLIFWSWILRMLICLCTFFFIYIFILASYSSSMQQAADFIHEDASQKDFDLIHNLALTSGALLVVVNFILLVDLIVSGRLMFDMKPWTPKEWSDIRVEASQAFYQHDYSIRY